MYYWTVYCTKDDSWVNSISFLDTENLFMYMHVYIFSAMSSTTPNILYLFKYQCITEKF